MLYIQNFPRKFPDPLIAIYPAFSRKNAFCEVAGWLGGGFIRDGDRLTRPVNLRVGSFLSPRKKPDYQFCPSKYQGLLTFDFYVLMGQFHELGCDCFEMGSNVLRLLRRLRRHWVGKSNLGMWFMQRQNRRWGWRWTAKGLRREWGFSAVIGISLLFTIRCRRLRTLTSDFMPLRGSLIISHIPIMWASLRSRLMPRKYIQNMNLWVRLQCAECRDICVITSNPFRIYNI